MHNTSIPVLRSPSTGDPNNTKLLPFSSCNFIKKRIIPKLKLENTEGENKKWTIQRNWQHRVNKTKKNKNTTHYVLDTTIRKQTQIT